MCYEAVGRYFVATHRRHSFLLLVQHKPLVVALDVKSRVVIPVIRNLALFHGTTIEIIIQALLTNVLNTIIRVYELIFYSFTTILPPFILAFLHHSFPPGKLRYLDSLCRGGDNEDESEGCNFSEHCYV